MHILKFDVNNPYIPIEEEIGDGVVDRVGSDVESA